MSEAGFPQLGDVVFAWRDRWQKASQIESRCNVDQFIELKGFRKHISDPTEIKFSLSPRKFAKSGRLKEREGSLNDTFLPDHFSLKEFNGSSYE